MAEYGRLEQWSIVFSPLPATVDQISFTALDKTFQSNVPNVNVLDINVLTVNVLNVIVRDKNVLIVYVPNVKCS